MGWKGAGARRERERERERERLRVCGRDKDGEWREMCNHSAEMLVENTGQKDPGEGLWFSNFILLKSC